MKSISSFATTSNISKLILSHYHSHIDITEFVTFIIVWWHFWVNFFVPVGITSSYSSAFPLDTLSQHHRKTNLYVHRRSKHHLEIYIHLLLSVHVVHHLISFQLLLWYDMIIISIVILNSKRIIEVIFPCFNNYWSCFKIALLKSWHWFIHFSIHPFKLHFKYTKYFWR